MRRYGYYGLEGVAAGEAEAAEAAEAARQKAADEKLLKEADELKKAIDAEKSGSNMLLWVGGAFLVYMLLTSGKKPYF